MECGSRIGCLGCMTADWWVIISYQCSPFTRSVSGTVCIGFGIGHDCIGRSRTASAVRPNAHEP